MRVYHNTHYVPVHNIAYHNTHYVPVHNIAFDQKPAYGGDTRHR